MEFRDQMFETIKSYRESDVLCDITIQVENQTFEVHKLMLAAASPYFKALFTIEMKKKNQKQITIKDVTSSAFCAFVEFIYTGQTNITTTNVKGILQASCLFQLWALKDKCLEFISVENCLDMWMLARKFDLAEIAMQANKMIFKNAETLLRSKEVLSNIDVGLFEEMLMSDELVIPNEDMLFEALLKWVQIDKEERNKNFCRLYLLIKLPMMSKENITETIMKNKHVYRECDQCFAYSNQAVAYFLVQKKNDGFTEHQLRKRNYTSMAYPSNTVLTVSNDCKKFKMFNFNENRFSDVNIQTISVKTYIRHVTIHNSMIYVMGGRNHNQCFKCNFRDQKWQELNSISIEHRDASVISYQNRILVAGGYDAKYTPIKTVESFDVETSTWSQFPDLNVSRSSMASVSHGDDVFVIGGLISEYMHDVSSVVERFDSASNQWKMMPELNKARCDAAAEFYKDKIFVIGGFSGQTWLSSVETYENGSNCWDLISCLNIARSTPGTAVVDDQLIVFGGKRGNNTSLYETFEDNKWKQSEIKNDEIISCCIFNM